MVSDPWRSEKGSGVPNLLSSSHDTHRKVELDGITPDDGRQKIKLQVVRAEGNGHCSGTRRKFREGGGKYWMGWFGGCFWLELHYCSGEVKYGGAVVMMMLVMTMTKMTFTERISSARCCAKTLHVLAHLNFTNNLTR